MAAVVEEGDVEVEGVVVVVVDFPVEEGAALAVEGDIPAAGEDIRLEAAGAIAVEDRITPTELPRSALRPSIDPRHDPAVEAIDRHNNQVHGQQPVPVDLDLPSAPVRAVPVNCLRPGCGQAAGLALRLAPRDLMGAV